MENFLENTIQPQMFFEKMFTKYEIGKIMEDSDYYFQDERFINAVKMFKPKKLLERLDEEEQNELRKEKE